MSSSWEQKTAQILRKYRVPFKEQFKPLPLRGFRMDFICKFKYGRYFAIEVDWITYHSWFKKVLDFIRSFLIKLFARVKIYRVSYTVVNKKFEKKIISIIKYEKFIRNLRIMIIVLIIFAFLKYFHIIDYAKIL